MTHLTEQQADEVEREMRRLEDDPAVSKRELRLFLQWPMPCGHAAGNLLTCDAPPFGCVLCNAVDGLRSSPPPPAPGENAEGLSVICRKCGSLVSGVEAGNRVRWVVCQKCWEYIITENDVEEARAAWLALDKAGLA